MASLDVYMNEYYVGIFTKKSSGAHSFQYAEELLIFFYFLYYLILFLIKRLTINIK